MSHIEQGALYRAPPVHIVERGMYVPHGVMSFLFGWHCVEEVGFGHRDGSGYVVPVRYDCGEYGVVRARGHMTLLGLTAARLDDLACRDDTCCEAIRCSTSMPEVIFVDENEYRIGVAEGTVDLLVCVPKHPGVKGTVSVLG